MLPSVSGAACDIADEASFVQIESRLHQHSSAKTDRRLAWAHDYTIKELSLLQKSGSTGDVLFDPSMMPPPSWFIGPQDDPEVTVKDFDASKSDLVFLHMPYNFGNTIEKIAMFPHNASRIQVLMYIMKLSGGKSFAGTDSSHIPSWEQVNQLTQPGGVVWGHFNPDLLKESAVTGCPLYLTPPKHWPEDTAKKYIGDKKPFAVLRDPYEKLVAQFRGKMKDYGGSDEKVDACDVNSAVKALMKKIVKTGDNTIGGCTNIPQSEFFEGKHGTQIAVDNWRFPQSANELFEKHNYPWHIVKEDVFHVWQCPDSWVGDFDDETRSLVKQVYAKDFELICKHFGHCEDGEKTCIQGVHTMCPEKFFTWDEKKELYCPAEGVDWKAENIRVRPECLASSESAAEESGAGARLLGITVPLAILAGFSSFLNIQ
jgi:hypothetical protein